MRWNKVRAFRSGFAILLVGTLVVSSAVLLSHSTSSPNSPVPDPARPAGRILSPTKNAFRQKPQLTSRKWTESRLQQNGDFDGANRQDEYEEDSEERKSPDPVRPQQEPRTARGGDVGESGGEGASPGEPSRSERIEEIPCLINGKRHKSACLKDTESQEVYVPFFGLVQNYFDLYGRISRTSEGSEYLEWWHNSSRIRLPSKKYNHLGTFGPFGGYNVELRERVRCVSGTQGVPMSTQWGSIPYFYPIQVAQFALEHYSKNITESPPTVIEYGSPDKWIASPAGAVHKEKLSSSDDSLDILYHVQTNGDPGSKVSVDLAESFSHVIQFDAVLLRNANISVLIEKTDSSELFRIDYVQKGNAESCIELNEEDDTAFVYPLGTESGADSKGSEIPGAGSWRRITRNVLTDLTKAIAHLLAVQQVQRSNKIKRLKPRKLKIPTESIRLKRVTFQGDLWVRHLNQRSSAHMDHFLDAADWFIKSQNSDGGWEVPVRRSLAKDKLVLEPGWVSAMGQGHGISVLTRAHALTNNPDYLAAALKATRLFSIDASPRHSSRKKRSLKAAETLSGKKGVRNWFLDTVPWYEEYPTTPGSFVLNGFIYSLLGLHDLKVTLAETGEDAQEVVKLYETGLESLRKLLPLYDTGSGSYYDLRHVTLQGIPPNLARWDYHSLHCYQLMWLYAIEKDPLFKETADRWLGYAHGKRAKHN